MSKEQIKIHLKQLHEELSQVDAADDETRQLLQKIDYDIHGLMESPQPSSTEVEHLKGRLDAMAIEFSATHPKAGTVIRELMDMLVKIGV